SRHRLRHPHRRERGAGARQSQGRQEEQGRRGDASLPCHDRVEAPVRAGGRMSPGAPEPSSPARAASGKRRSAARLAAVQALYQIELTGVLPGSAEVEKVIGEFIRDRLGKEIDGETYNEADQAMFADIVRGASSRLRDIDGMIASALSPEWPIERLETVLR